MIEELVEQIRNGSDGLIAQLWEELRPYVAGNARRFIETWSGYKDVEVEDLIQCGFFAVMDSVDQYDPEKGPFTALLSWQLRKCFQDAVGRTEKKLQDPIRNALSLDAPIDSSDPDGSTLQDVIPDRRDRIQEAENRIYRDQLHAALEAALSSLKPDEAHVLRSVFFHERTVEETAAGMGTDVGQVKRLVRRGLSHLRTCRERNALESYVDARTPFYYRVGVDAFCRTHESAVEKLATLREGISRDFSK